MNGLEHQRVDFEATPFAAKSHWMGWAIFVGISWTWCIGMFLPVILVREFGIWGWIVFAIPNVVGASAMGWTLTAEASRAITLAHHELLDAFAIVTSAFQIFFIGWIANLFIGSAGWILVALVIGVAAMLPARVRSKRAAIAVGGFTVSLLCAIVFMFSSSRALSSSPALGRLTPSAISFSVVSCLGFALCPYLDATFHRARQSLGAAAAKRAFGIGFGVVFFSMIIFSLMYSTTVASVVWGGVRGVTIGVVTTCLLVHWTTQTLLTVLFHIDGDDSERETTRKRLRLTGSIVLAFLALLGAFVFSNNLTAAGIFIYWLFMSGYGLIFPAYVWLCMIPGRGRLRPTRRMWMVTSIVVIVAMPLYWQAFINNRMIFVVAGVGIVLVARLFVGNAAAGEVIDLQQNSAPTS